MRIRFIVAECAVAFLLFTAVARTNAAIAISTAGFGPTSVVDFSQFASTFYLGSGPIQVGALVSEDIEWSSTYSDAFLGDSPYGLGANGTWDPARIGFVGLNTFGPNLFMRFDFNDGPVSAVGGFVNYADLDGIYFMEALDIFDNVLETFDVANLAPISTPAGTNAGAFRGFLRGTSDIAALRLTGSFNVLDDLTFSRSSVVPEPLSVAVWLGLVICGFRAAKRCLVAI